MNEVNPYLTVGSNGELVDAVRISEVANEFKDVIKKFLQLSEFERKIFLSVLKACAGIDVKITVIE